MPNIAVFGATGNQGAAVVRSLAALKVNIRAITRDPNSAKSQALTKLSASSQATVVPTRIDLDDLVSSKTTAANPLEGVDVVFANTNTFEAGPEKEVTRAKALVDAAKEAGVGLFIWSTLPSANKVSGGKYTHVEHFEAKAQVTDYLKASGLKWAALTLGWFAENIPSFHIVQQDGADAFKVQYSLMKPETRVAWTWVAKDLGPVTAAIVEAHLSNSTSANVFNRIIPACGYQASMGDLVAAVEKASGKRGTFVQLPPFGNRDMDHMHRLYNEFGLYKDVPLPDPELLKLGLKLSTLDDVVEGLVLPGLK